MKPMKKDNEDVEWLSVVRQHVETLSFGVVQIIVHDSKIVQVERTEKIRFELCKPGKEVKT